MSHALENLPFYKPLRDLQITRDRLPHWEQEGAVYFLSFRLADSLPKSLLNGWEGERATWLRRNPEPWTTETEAEYHKRFSAALERALDANHGSCVLRAPECRQLVADTLLHFDNERYVQLAFVIMPNHVHALFIQNPAWELKKIVRSWKSFPARQINALLQRSEPLWQRDYFDRMVRDQTHFKNCLRYIRRNPEKARLAAGEYSLYEHSIAKAIE